MVERSGNHLVVRSLVNGVPLYQTALEGGEDVGLPTTQGLQPLLGTDTLERQLEQYRVSNLMYPIPLPGSVPVGAAAPADLVQEKVEGALHPEGNPSNNEEELPQCKIRRNYSCNQCSFFTQNPRCHLSHLRDVHGERIVINECKLCLYASRHFQKLVRHMKMVHGCSDDAGGVPGSGGQLRGKRNLSREVRKRRLEESIEMQATAGPCLNPSLVRMLQNGPPLEQLKIELQKEEQQLLASVQAYSRQQEMLQLQQIVDNNDNIFSMAYEFQAKLMPSKQSESLKLDQNNSSSDSEEASKSPTPDNFELPPGEKQFQCQKCSYSTPIRSRFKKHVKYHSMPLIKCSSCDFHTPYKWNLDRHTKNHGAHGHFKCSACDFSTDIKQSLTIHELNHHVPSWDLLLNVAVPQDLSDLLNSCLVYDSSARIPPMVALGHCSYDELRIMESLGLRMPNHYPLPPLFNFTSQELGTDPKLWIMLLPLHLSQAEEELPAVTAFKDVLEVSGHAD